MIMENFKTYLSEDGTEICGETKILFGQCGADRCLHLTEIMEYCADYVNNLNVCYLCLVTTTTATQDKNAIIAVVVADNTLTS